MGIVQLIRRSQHRSPARQLGIDAGSISIKLLLVGPKGIEFSAVERHHGDPIEALRRILEATPSLKEARRVAVTGHHASLVAEATHTPKVDTITCTIAGVRHSVGPVTSILDLGGNSLTRIRLDEAGRFLGFEANTLCAAGTGSFLDEQALRMGITPEMLGQTTDVETPPTIASRCAVFAKSDLIHRQQEGHTRSELWAGLCRSLARTAVSTLYKGTTPSGATAAVGGMLRNAEIVRWLVPALGLSPLIPDAPEFVTALGASYLASQCNPVWESLDLHAQAERSQARRPALRLNRSTHPSFQVADSYLQEGTEVRVHRLDLTGHVPCFLGIDVGSTSTKLLLVDANGAPLLDAYRKTAGDPIGATQSLVQVLQQAEKRLGTAWDIRGVGTTGSGRKLIGAYLHADCVLNEITAHATGALSVDPTVQTLFEIGGQDAKYVRIENGSVADSNMNYVCAAGTGSFVEELARKLGFDVAEVGTLVDGVTPPFTSDRCTVFMEQDVQTLLRENHTREEVMGAVLYSVFQNYLRKVVGQRPVSKSRVFFQGATARNRGLVAALENLLQVEVVVSPLCHVMGALGVALETRNRLAKANQKTSFVGLAKALGSVSIRQEGCSLCNNHCTITHLKSDGSLQAASWGYLCGRDGNTEKVRLDPGHELFRQRQLLFHKALAPAGLAADAPSIGIPRALMAHTYGPFFASFFASLGKRLEWSRPTNPEVIETGNRWVPADVCLPVKLAHGHLAELLAGGKSKLIFAPHLISGPASPKTTNSFFCPYNIGIPGMLDAAMELQGEPVDRLLRCTMDFRWSDAEAAEHLVETLGNRLGVNKQALRKAWKAGAAAQQAFDDAVRDTGRRWVSQRTPTSRPAVVFLGRSYNLYDKGVNLDIPAKLASLGFDVVPMECLPLAEEPLGEEFQNMYWHSGRAILEAARIVGRTPGLYACYLTNFSCGPDSFVQSQVESILVGKPMLTLELDEHGGDAGYWTRLEAFAEVVRHSPVAEAAYKPRLGGTVSVGQLGKRTLWIPPMHEVSPSLAAAVMRRAGVDARALPPETVESFADGKRHTRGTECVPCPATLGSFLHAVHAAGGESGSHALFMPTASGPCRFGQYCSLDRRALDTAGMEATPLVSWTSTDSYGGLDMTTRKRFWQALVLGDLLYKARCRVLPYEKVPGSTEETFRHYGNRLEHAFEHGSDLERLVATLTADFQALLDPTAPPKPLVGIVGEIYVRQNRFTNQDVVRRIEANGGEAWLAPITEWILYTSYMERWLSTKTSLWNRLGCYIQDRWLDREEKRWTRRFDSLLSHRHEPEVVETMEDGRRYFPYEFEGESILTVGRSVQFARQGAAMVVNCAPFGCMPGSMTGGILQALQRQTNIPMVSLFYDGEGDINCRLDTFLSNLANVEPAMEDQKSRSETNSMAIV